MSAAYGSLPLEHWQRLIVCVDMNAFFASIEQQRDKSLRHKAVAVTNGHRGSAIITSSYEARMYGIKTGMRLAEAYRLCPDLVQCASKPSIYIEVSKRLISMLKNEFTPDIEVFSVDEAFLDFSRMLNWRHFEPRVLAKQIQERIKKVLGLPSSVGVAQDKTMAKYASKCIKPMGITVIDPMDYEKILSYLPAHVLCGIGPKIARYLAGFGAHTCAEVARLPVSMLSKRWGYMGQRLWLMCAGRDPDPVKVGLRRAKSMGHGKRLPPGTYGREKIVFYLHHMAFKLSFRLAKHGVFARVFAVAVKIDGYWCKDEISYSKAHADYFNLITGMKKIMKSWPIDHGICTQVQITAQHLSDHVQGSLCVMKHDQEQIESKKNIAKLMKEIGERWGYGVLRPARLIKSLPSNDVIAPAWRGEGDKQSICV